MPEELPSPEKSIQQIEQEQMDRLKAKEKKEALCWISNSTIISKYNTLV